MTQEEKDLLMKDFIIILSMVLKKNGKDPLKMTKKEFAVMSDVFLSGYGYCMEKFLEHEEDVNPVNID